MASNSTTESIPIPTSSMSTLSSVLSDDLSLDSYLNTDNIEKNVQIDEDSNLEKLADFGGDSPTLNEDAAISAAVEAAQAAVENDQDAEMADAALASDDLTGTDLTGEDLADAELAGAEIADAELAGDADLADINLGEVSEDLNLPDGAELSIPEEDSAYMPDEEEEEEDEDESDGSDEEDESSDESGESESEEEGGEPEAGGSADIEAPPDLASIIDDPEPVAMDTDLQATITEDLLPKVEAPEEKKEVKPEKKTRKRKKRSKGEKGEKKAKKAKRKSGSMGKRKNIRSIIKEDELDADTLAAQNEEFERKKRLQEIQKSLLATKKAEGQKAEEEKKEKDKEKDCQLKSLLQAAEEEATKAENDVVILDDEDKKPEIKKEPEDVIDISSDEDCIVVEKEEDKVEEEVEEEDVNNGGAHINDELNCQDKQGRVLVNIGHPPTDPDIFMADKIAKNIKPHQIGGVRFLYDNLVESLSRFSTSSGFGCILAHSMGLGKTIQMISFTDIFLRYTTSKTALCIVPINTLQNWMSEFNHWVPIEPTPEFPNVAPRPYKVYLMNDTFKTTAARAKLLKEWSETGGVLLMGYEMYRLLSSKRSFPAKKKSKKVASATSAGPDVIDVDEEDKNKSLMIDMQSSLVNPGPDLVVCDEGHRIKNSHTGISHSLKNIRTRRRVVLTGYPLQNNLLEYWCMVDFVRPNFLGTKTEFSNMFERPIMNGQCSDSTLSDIKLMRHRAYVLHSLLEGFVQRRGHTVLQKSLPRKSEHVFLIKMSPLQRKLYNTFMSDVENSKGDGPLATMNPLKAFAVCCKIWNHPDILHKLVSQQKNEAAPESDLDIDTEGGGTIKKKKPTPNLKSDPEKNVISYDWAHDLMKEYVPGLVENGGKMAILFSIIEHTLALGEKILVFSQSLFTLNLLEDLLSQNDVPRPDMQEKWSKNKSYFRLDGSTPGTEREKLINQFNDRENKRCWLFLLSTRAGCLGINLIGANRVVVLDASWNPCHDCQAVCRVYRFGQDKQSYIYRLVTDNSLEKKIYDRQVTKQGMSDRVVDELNPENQFTHSQVGNLLHYQDKDLPNVDFSGVHENFDDTVLVNVLKTRGHWVSKEPFTHESLLIDKKELRLSKREKQMAKEAYARDKKMNISYTRPSYAAFYPRGPSGAPIAGPYIRRVGPSRPVASVKPMISTPVPMRLKADGKTPVGTIVRPGVTVHQVITTTDIVLPGNNTNTQAGMPRRIPAGQQVLVIKTLKGVYIRTSDGKLFAVRSKTASNLAGGPSASTVTPASTSGVITLTTSKAAGALGAKPKTTCTTIVIPRTKNLNTNTPASIKIVRPNITLKTATGQGGGVIVSKASLQGAGGASMLASIYNQTKAVNKIINKSQQSKAAAGSSADSKSDSEAGQDKSASNSNSPRVSDSLSTSSSPAADEYGILGGQSSGRWTKPSTVVLSSSTSAPISSISSLSVSSLASSSASSSVSVSAPAVASSAKSSQSSPAEATATRSPVEQSQPPSQTTASKETHQPTPTPHNPSTQTNIPKASVPPSAPTAQRPPPQPRNDSPPSTFLDLDSMKTTTVRPFTQSQSRPVGPTYPQQNISQVCPIPQNPTHPDSGLSSSFSISSLTSNPNPMQSQYGQNNMNNNPQMSQPQSGMHGFNQHMPGNNQPMPGNSEPMQGINQPIPTPNQLTPTNNQAMAGNNQGGNNQQMPGNQMSGNQMPGNQMGGNNQPMPSTINNQPPIPTNNQHLQSQPGMTNSQSTMPPNPPAPYNQQPQTPQQYQKPPESRQTPGSHFPPSNSQTSSQPGSMYGNPLANLTAQFGSGQSGGSGMSMPPFQPKPVYPGQSSQDTSSTQQSANSDDSTMQSQQSQQRSYGDPSYDTGMNYNNMGGFGSNNYYNMGSQMSQGHSGGGNQGMMHNPYFGGGLSSYPYPSHMSMLGQGPGMGYNPYGMQSHMSNPMQSSMPMMGGHGGMMSSGMMPQSQNSTASSTADSSSMNSSQNSSQSASSNPNSQLGSQSNVPQMPMPFHPGMYGMPPNPLPYQPFMNTPSMYMPYMPPMMPTYGMGGMGSPMSQSSQMGGYSQAGGYGQTMSQEGAARGDQGAKDNK